MKINSLRWRIILPPLLIILVGFLSLYKILPNSIHRIEIDAASESLSSQILVFQNTLEDQWTESNSRENFQPLMDEWAKQTSAQILIVLKDGSLLGASSPSLSIEPDLYFIDIQQTLELTSFVDDTHSPPLLYISTPIQSHGTSQAVLRIIYPLNEIEASSAAIRQTLLLSVLAVISLTTISLIVLTSVYGKRLKNISSAISDISKGNRDIHLQVGLLDEVGTISHETNHLAKNLKQEFSLMQNEQAKLNAVLTQMNDGVMILDNKGVILLANQAALKIFKFTDVDVDGLRLVRVIRNHHVIELWEEFQNTGEDQASLIEISETNQSIQIFLTPLGYNLPGYSLFYIQDLTKMRRLEKVRRDFISNISHELRTPLASLKALSDTLQVSLEDDPEASNRFLKRMDTEIDALAQMVSELLELSRIESGQVPIELALADANRILNRAYERLAIQAEREKIELKIKSQKEPTTIMVDETRIEQVLVNIIHNAIKFTPKNGKIVCSVFSKGEETIFKIQDNGQGISSEDLPRIFERFYKSKRQNAKAGTGLGLSIVKHLTEANGGRIWVESTFGEGTTFFIAFKSRSPLT